MVITSVRSCTLCSAHRIAVTCRFSNEFPKNTLHRHPFGHQNPHSKQFDSEPDGQTHCFPQLQRVFFGINRDRKGSISIYLVLPSHRERLTTDNVERRARMQGYTHRSNRLKSHTHGPIHHLMDGVHCSDNLIVRYHERFVKRLPFSTVPIEAPINVECSSFHLLLPGVLAIYSVWTDALLSLRMYSFMFFNFFDFLFRIVTWLYSLLFFIFCCSHQDCSCFVILLAASTVVTVSRV